MMKSILEDIVRQPKIVFEKNHPNALLPKKAYANDWIYSVLKIVLFQLKELTT